MRRFCITAALCCLWLCNSASSSNAESHRLLVLDGIKPHGALRSEVLLIDVESGRILARADAGSQARMGLSPQGDVVGISYLQTVAGGTAGYRTDLYRANDLTPLESGYLPVSPIPLMSSGGTFYFSPDGRQFVVQHRESTLNDDKPVRRTFNSCSLHPVKRELDEEGVFKLGGRPVEIPRCSGVVFLRVTEWPRAVVWGGVGILYVVDFSTGEIENQFAIFDDPRLRRYDASFFERPNIGKLIYRLTFRGAVHTRDGQTAYYVPSHPPPSARDRGLRPGFLRRIDLTADPPKVLMKSEKRQPDLHGGIVAISPAGALFVVKKKLDGNFLGKSNRIQAFRTQDLAFLNEIQVPLTDCRGIAASEDGEYLYALSPDEAKIAVIDVQTGREVKVLDGVGKHPVMMFPLPEQSGQ